MNVLLWLIQGILALVFLLHGLLFLVMPARAKEQFKQSALPLGFGRFIGFAEVLAVFGLILPGWTHMLRWLTPLAAILLLPIMIGAVVIHQRHHEQSQVIFCCALIVLLAVIAIWRIGILPL
jgi:uncharacterized protein YjeT (DUF2065 family)